MSGSDGSGHGAPPQFRNIHRFYWQSTGTIEDCVDFFGANTFKLHRLPDDIGELRFPVGRRGEVPFAGKQASCLFARTGFSQDGGGHHIGVEHQPYGRPSSIAL